MTPERWKRVNELFQSALDRPEAERERFLGEACAEDEPLRQEVSSLLSAHERAGTFIESEGTTLGPRGALPRVEDDAEPLLEPGRRLGPYEVQGLLGSGGMGQVYRAHDPRLGRDVAVKVLSPSRRSPEEAGRLEREARAAASLAHPNVLAVHDVDHDGEVPYIVSELLQGETLSTRLETGPLPIRECLDYARQIAAGLAAAHEKGIVHRDLKPDNLFLTREGFVKILDFGLAKQAPAFPGGASRSPGCTQPGVVLGTVGYMSPEQVRGLAADERSDVFAAGVVLYEMAARRRAFSAGSPVETMSAILHDEPPELMRLPPGLGAVVRRCLEKDPSRRFASGRALLAALEMLSDAPASLAAGPVAAQTSVAVLPFVDLSPKRDHEYLCEGMAEELMAALGRIEGLRVAARSSAFRFRGATPDLTRIRAELGVDKVLEGSIRRSGGRVRVAVQLLDAVDGFQAWSERYERPLEDVFAVQDEIAERVALALRAQLGAPGLAPPRRRYTEDPEAYQLYLKGRYHWNRRYEGGLRKGLEAFEQAVLKDPGHALALSGLADSWSVLGFYGLVAPREAFPRARHAAERALALDDLLPEAHVSMGMVQSWFDWDWDAAEASFLRALTLRPDHAAALCYLGRTYAVRGRTEESAACVRRAALRDPLSPLIQAMAAQTLYLAHRWEAAAEYCDRALELDHDHPVALFTSALILSRTKRHHEAVAVAEKVVRLEEGGAFYEGVLGAVEARAGRIDRARERARALLERSSREYVPAFSLAQIHAALGDVDDAFAWLERAFAERNPYLGNLERESWEALRSDSRFADLSHRLGLGAVAEVPLPERVPAVAVLPFKNLGTDAESAHLALGLADATITELGRLRTLLVRPISTVLRYEGANTDPVRAGRELAVDAVVDGSFERTGQQLRVTVRLTSAADARSMWSTRILTSLDDVFRMQDEVARSIARALHVELGPAEDTRHPRPAAPAPGAYEMYLKGRAILQKETLPDFIAAVDAFQQARDMDPQFAPAWAALADTYERIAFQFQPEGDWYTRAVAMCDRALALDPTLPEGLYVRGRMRWGPRGGWDNEGALRDIIAALQGRPDLDEALDRLGVILWHVGLVDEGLAELQKVLELSPGHTQARYHVGLCRYHQGHYADALAISEAVAAEAPASWIHYQTAICQVRLGRLEEAARTAELMRRVVRDEVLVHPVVGLVAAARGREREAREAVRRIVEARRGFGHYHHAQYDMACILARFGDTGEAVRSLRDAARSGYPCASFFARDPWLEPLHGKPDWERLLGELRTEGRAYASIYAGLVASRRGGAP